LAAGGLAWYVWRAPEGRINRGLDVGLAAALGLLTVGLVYGLYYTGVTNAILEWIAKWQEESKDNPSGFLSGFRNYIFKERYKIPNILKFAVPAILVYTFVERPVRFGLGVAAMLLAGSSAALLDKDVLLRERSFFGVLRVEKSTET